MSVTLNSSTDTDCVVTIDVTVVASAPMVTTLTFDITGHPSVSVDFVFTDSNLSQNEVVAEDVDGTVSGTATVSGMPGSTGWMACTPPSGP